MLPVFVLHHLPTAPCWKVCSTWLSVNGGRDLLADKYTAEPKPGVKAWTFHRAEITTAGPWGFLKAPMKDQSPGCDHHLWAKLRINAWISKSRLKTQWWKSDSRRKGHRTKAGISNMTDAVWYSLSHPFAFGRINSLRGIIHGVQELSTTVETETELAFRRRGCEKWGCGLSLDWLHLMSASQSHSPWK